MKKYAIWGLGYEFEKNIELIDPEQNIVRLIDRDVKKQGKRYTENNILCEAPEAIEKDWIVIITVRSLLARKEIESYLDDRGIEHCTIYDILEEYRTKLEKIYDQKNQDNNCEDKIVKYLDCSVPIGKCNLKCSYCYLAEEKKKRTEELQCPHTSYIIKALSPKRLGGIALINFCGNGETMLWDGLLPLMKGLVDDGHYVSVATNGTITQQFDKMLHMDIDFSHVFIKFSFHYLELKKLNLLQIFVDNVKKMHEAGCSFSVELVSSDELIFYIDEIKKMSLENFGALPQVSVARDETVKELKILTDLSENEFKEIWGGFKSPMFEFKFNEVGKKRFSDCMAGVWSAQLNIETGDLYKCTKNPWIDNIYKDINSKIKWNPVKDKCCLPYCFNNHSYLALGVMKGIQAPSYYEIRDRKMENGDHWVKDKMKNIFSQKLWVNNGQ